VSETCAHGLPAADCLICRTLGTGPPAPAGPTGPAVRTRHRPRWRGGDPSDTAGGGAPAVQPDAVYPTGTEPRPGTGRGGVSLVGVILALIAIAAVIWVVSSVVFSLLHVFELAVAALIAGWVGYRIGHYRGRHVKQ
jgi:hypothetical protein